MKHTGQIRRNERVINNYLKVIRPDGKIERIITFDDGSQTQVSNAKSFAQSICPPRGRIVAWRAAMGLHVDGVTGVVP